MIGIEAISVCVGYGDILEVVAPYNRPLLKRWAVATHSSDNKTRDVCRRFSIECLLTDDFYLDDPDKKTVQKARGINRAMEQLCGDEFLLNLDADILLPFDLHQCLEDAKVEKGSIYGCERINITGADNFKKVRDKGFYSRENGWLVEKRRQDTWVGGVPAGPGNGYAPIGFFQLWHGSESLSWGFPKKRYPERHGNAARTDVQFALQWDRRKRVFIPELVVFHVESEDARMGANWNGRKTKPFVLGQSPPTTPGMMVGGSSY